MEADPDAIPGMSPVPEGSPRGISVRNESIRFIIRDRSDVKISGLTATGFLPSSPGSVPGRRERQGCKVRGIEKEQEQENENENEQENENEKTRQRGTKPVTLGHRR